jgi:hypothetical protein
LIDAAIGMAKTIHLQFHKSRTKKWAFHDECAALAIFQREILFSLNKMKSMEVLNSPKLYSGKKFGSSQKIWDFLGLPLQLGSFFSKFS